MTGDGNPTAAQLVVTVPQPDDSGANTADRYEWQAAMAAAQGLSLYLDAIDEDGRLASDEDRRIICEYHEDWVAVHGDNAVLVSGKHRDPEVGAYTTINQLADKGGLAHLFLRWHALKEKPTCKLVTTGGLSNGAPQDLEAAAKRLRLRRLANETFSITKQDVPVVNSLHSAIRTYGESHLPREWTGEEALSLDEQKTQTARFLSALSIDHAQVMRAHLPHAAPNMFAKPVVDRLSLETPPEAVWQAVLGLFRTRMRAAGPNSTGALPTVFESVIGTGVPTVEDSERALANRIVTMQDIHIAIVTATVNPGAYQPIAPPIRMTRAAVKMAAGECSDNSIERAEQLRRDYHRYWHNRMSGDPTAIADREKFRRLLLRISDKATTPKVRASSPWGAALWNELQDVIDGIPAEEIPVGLDADLLLGGISDLANVCQIWFSERFDVDAEIARLRARRGTAA
ncbi:hypothetical protein GCM10023195_82940 [Actinoallomurus liliacearum]|uniref:CD-NTase associated protein 4-like DNA endonuclease domain-containing protein n=1 Tax=Actinoallomurus liliacearum TaxID=1080073 RepID=A0ABP8TXF9_9ACTN